MSLTCSSDVFVLSHRVWFGHVARARGTYVPRSLRFGTALRFEDFASRLNVGSTDARISWPSHLAWIESRTACWITSLGASPRSSGAESRIPANRLCLWHTARPQRQPVLLCGHAPLHRAFASQLNGGESGRARRFQNRRFLAKCRWNASSMVDYNEGLAALPPCAH